MFVRSLGLALGLSLAASAAFAQTPVELKVGDAAPDFTLQASDGKTYTPVSYTHLTLPTILRV